VPQPKAGEVLVKVIGGKNRGNRSIRIFCFVQVFSAGINPSDAKNALGSFKHEGIVLPRTPGRDFAGVVRPADT
jgi:hypothetical protein